MKKEEATTLLKELGDNQLVSVHLVLLEQKEPGKYQLQIRGDYNRQLLATFLRKRHLAWEIRNDYLTIL
jgi:hypothetical protein